MCYQLSPYIDTIHMAITRVLEQAPTLQAGISATETLNPFCVQLGSINLEKHNQRMSPQELSDKGSNLQEIVAAVRPAIHRARHLTRLDTPLHRAKRWFPQHTCHME